MNGNGEGSGVEMERVVYMWGYLPGALQKRSPLLSPVVVKLPPSSVGAGTSWKDVSGGGCGFAMAISENGEVFTWGWKECIPSGKVIGDPSVGLNIENSETEKQTMLFTEQVSPRFQGSGSAAGAVSVSRGVEDGAKRRRVSSSRQAAESSSSNDESLSALPCLVTLNPGVRVVSVAAGGRHTLALSVPDIGQVWGWGYGGEGQLGLGSRIRMVSSPHPIPCISSSPMAKDRVVGVSHGSMGSEGQGHIAPGSYVKAIACGGRHSAVVTDAGALLTFGWGLYGQCGQGSTDDELSPACVSSLLGIRIKSVAAGLWHTLCISADGDVYAFGGNQFGQLGTGGDQAETLPRLLDAPSLENVNAKVVSCGARHSAIVTEDSKVFCWGWNKYGQLGLGDVIDRNIPTQMSIDGCVPKKVSCGWWHTLLLAESPT
ncbi:PREDICTED: ultraviolet-B receptor UVR8-like isoform X3 [Ipomoea nil]|uniref:ultraviolet-B receptor UVR8-like isoform X3 n=1 Tax=Ipomoea nil TaxID=35883 RepID=UPI000900D240|nr:PREDICTED: ultraviolet-B receptor UVR8-like isoform X3 [Ipomoea nil]